MAANNNLLKAERHGKIQALINEQGRATVQELSYLFAVSEATIRRDLEELNALGAIRRTHGGAVNFAQAPKEPPMMQRMDENKVVKTRIGRAAVELIKDGETIFLGSGTTVIEVAHHLPENINLTVISNSLPVVNELATHPGIELIVRVSCRWLGMWLSRRCVNSGLIRYLLVCLQSMLVAVSLTITLPKS